MNERRLLPTFIIGGAPRSGTTFLCHALDKHPDVFIAKPYSSPEPKVFMGSRCEPEIYYERYAAFFGDVIDKRVLGEKTSYYLESEEACEMIRRILPDVRMVFIVREPVARAYSNFLWSTKNKLESLSFEEAIEFRGERPSQLPPEKSYARPYDYLERGDYATFAKRYYDAFDRGRVAFFLYEDIQRRPIELFRSIQTYIGVDPIPFDRLDVGYVNSTFDVGPPIHQETEAKLRERMGPWVRRFADLTGLDVSPWGYPGIP